MPSIGCYAAIPNRDGGLTSFFVDTPLAEAVDKVSFAPPGYCVGLLEAREGRNWKAAMMHELRRAKAQGESWVADVDPAVTIDDLMPARVWYNSQDRRFVITAHEFLLQEASLVAAIISTFDLPADACQLSVDPACVRTRLAWMKLSPRTHTVVLDPASGQTVIVARPITVNQASEELAAIRRPATRREAVNATYTLRDPRHRAAEYLLYARLPEGLSRYRERTLSEIELSHDPVLARETLTLLVRAGLIERTDEAAGTFTLRPFRPYRELEGIFPENEPVTAYDVFDNTATFEVATAGFAAECLHWQDRRLLRHAIRWVRHGTDKKAINSGFAAFTVALAHCTRNPGFVVQTKTIMTARCTDLWCMLNRVVDDAADLVAAIEADRTRIVAAILRRDRDAARAAMQEHLTRVQDFLFAPVTPS